MNAPITQTHAAAPQDATKARPYRREWVLLLLVIGLLAALLANERRLDFIDTRAAEEARLLGLARTVADNLQRQLHSVNSVLANLQADYPWAGRDAAHVDTRQLQLFSDMTGARSLSLFDAQGTMLASNRAELVGRNFRERPYFRSLPARPDADALYLSTPYTTALGAYSVNLSRVALGPQGELIGLVSATLDPAYFEVLARSVLYADDMTVSFVHGDGTLFFSLPNLPTAVGRNLNQPGAIFTQHMASGQTSTVVAGTLKVTGSKRMIANHNLQPAGLRMHQPLVIGVARDLSGIDQAWRRETLLHVLSFALLAAGASVALALSQRRRNELIAEAAARERVQREQAQRQADELAERLQATQVGLRGTREHLALAADAARLGIWVRDVATDEVWVSDAWRALFGFDRSEALTVERFVQRVHAEDMDVIEGARSASQRLGRYQAEYRIVLPDGAVRWIASFGRMEYDEQGRPAVFRAVSMEITERKLAELQLQQQRREVTHLSRVVMLGELSGALAHELNQPLTAILSNAQAALRFMAQAPIDLDELRDILDDIVSEDLRAGEVIKRLRQLLSTGETQRAPLDLNELIVDTFKLLRSDLLHQKVTLHTELEPALPRVWADRVQLQQVLINLVVNACDAMRELPAAQRRLRVRTARRADGAVQLSVVDQGCGLPGEQPERVFESFYTTKAGGMGLGLSVCRTIIQAHGGRLWAESHEGPGASFHVSLSAHTAPPP